MSRQSEPRGHPGSSIDNDEQCLVVESDSHASVRHIGRTLFGNYQAFATACKGEEAE